MEQLAKSFIQELGQKQHVFQVLQNRRLTVHFHSEAEHLYLRIEDGRADVTSQMECEMEIYGPKTTLTHLFQQKIKLRQLMKEQPIQIKGPFRSILLLETILYLGKN
ncbi:MAG: SCP2 sterol-binding domain-containing protein [Cytobacillus gottheilii]|uniref:SCP2 sterol-binding domain-containing protein n=1 Tax=Cytobacillus gottheilii TaxID=859144 RepID=UPI0008342B55|nr:SCP2 sterol-binding domain-containing protein [Cytobacillus gottheilii]